MDKSAAFKGKFGYIINENVLVYTSLGYERLAYDLSNYNDRHDPSDSGYSIKSKNLKANATSLGLGVSWFIPKIEKVAFFAEANISKIHSSMIDRNASATNASATNASVANEDISLQPRPIGRVNRALDAYKSDAADVLRANVDLQAINTFYPESIGQATRVSDGIITKYFKTNSLDEAYSKDIGHAIATIFAKNIEPYEVDIVVKAAEIAAEQAYNRKAYDVAVNKYLKTQTKIIRPVLVGGALPDDYNYETNLQISIIKGIDSSAFFRLNNVSASVKKGGQRTQKNRNKSRSSGGTRKNMNSIEMDDIVDV
jgi:hypothetical protein